MTIYLQPAHAAAVEPRLPATSPGRQVADLLVDELDPLFNRLVAHHARAAGVETNDLRQEAMVRILKQHDVDPQHQALVGWLDRCVRYAALDLRRQASRDRSEPSANIPDGIDQATPEQIALRRELEARTAELLRTLTPHQRDILTMRILLSRSVQETADTLGISPDAVRIGQYRALNQLRRRVDRAGESPEPSRESGRVRFNILGPIEMICGTVPVQMSSRQLIILGVLLLEPNRVVSVDRLVDAVWGEQAPRTAHQGVRVHIAALRRVFAKLGFEQPIVTGPQGYLLRVTHGQLDSQIFDRLVQAARDMERKNRLETAAELYRQALALWRGPALGGDTRSALRGPALQLEESRAATIQAYADLEQRLGRPDAALSIRRASRRIKIDRRPCQMPADILVFTGREELIERAEAALLPGGRVVITGEAGIGKTALAVHVAHRVAGWRFPDGQLYGNLASTQRTPATPSEVLGRFLRALGASEPEVPDDLEERARMYRGLLAGRRLLVLLDDVIAVRQVTPLLPDGGTCALVVTSRAQLTGIPGATGLNLDPLQPDRSIDLLGKVIGARRVARESSAAATLVRMVGGLPLTLRIVAARLAARPNWSLAAMVRQLAEERQREERRRSDRMTHARRLLTYQGLARSATYLARLLGTLTTQTVPAWITRAILADTPGDTK